MSGGRGQGVWTTRPIAVKTATGSVGVEAAVLGDWAVHLATRPPGVPDYGLWAVTYLPVGYKLPYLFETEQAARTAAADMDGLGDWRDAVPDGSQLLVDPELKRLVSRACRSHGGFLETDADVIIYLREVVG